ncbi:MgtC/SapB family protein [Sinorhizobium meliloti]|uniref:MgtC/SapB family protein n=1 Tax=Rhizobium meliloti TaxID=382 RepID=UPI000FDBCDDB|nr:MgtC/SapB family protein [Sinorhizobium meliloti]RVI66057.1 MgtC/SapB family protein [Sinorhizobium meliloti]
MADLGFEFQTILSDIARILLAFALALPIGWERRHGRRSIAFRTLPIVALAACGFALIIDTSAPADNEARARVLQGVITGIGFIGGGAIVKQGSSVKGLVTAASIWNAGAIGVAVGLGAATIAIVLSLTNLLGLWLLSTLGVHGREDDNGNPPS